ncbi:polysaccharide deacetylase family protein [Novosphingobium sp. G106]|uniref:polysaccharide deacetylase family protein n=1 Tax=Novosphingobium sp. G106 TaxID=2849500 RepID=UPI001C2D1DF9|nr:polysaccharide deacetylase family protein [Novosphingobium sp. G106]MBV1689558.1 polysaccharide deacetylase family protein [Novosphingobium sp. G106]
MLTFLSQCARTGLSASTRRRAKHLVEPILSPIGTIERVRSSTRAVALTFDDGPDDLVTPRVLDKLSEYGATATFFVLTDRARDQPALIARMIAEGHEVALHCDRHDRLTTLPLGEVRSRLAAAKSELEHLTGRKVEHFRPPFGAQSFSTLAVARLLGFEIVGWGPYAEDWIEQTPQSACDKALGNVASGDIILLHDGMEMPAGDSPPAFDRVAMVDLILSGLADRNIQPVSVEKLVTLGPAVKTPWFRA